MQTYLIFPPSPDPNLTAILSFLQENKDLVTWMVLMFVALILVFTVIMRSTTPKPKPEEIERDYTVKYGEEEKIIRANDVDIDWEKEGGVVNFLGPLDESGSRPSVAYLSWSSDMTIHSEPVER